ncbi:redoxin domain-containing protein [Bacteroidota bacterium]
MKKYISITLFVIFLVPVINVFSQGYKIEVTINDLKNEELYLAYHYASKVYVLDTVRTDENSYALFTGEEKLEGGMYLVYLPNKDFFDFLISDDQEIKFQTGIENLVENMKVTGSKENDEFFKFQKYLKTSRQKQAALRNDRNKPNISQSEKDKINLELNKLNDAVNFFWDNIIETNRGSFVATFLSALKEIKVPPAPVDANGQAIDQYFRYNYFVNHFFDNVDLSDPKLIRTSILNDKLERYFTKILVQSADSILPAALTIIEKAKKGNFEVFKFIVQNIINRYSSPKIMGTDAIYVAVAELYYLSGIADWISDSDLNIIKERVKMIKPNLIGRTAPNLIMESPEGETISLHDFKSKYTILLFWDHECGHCKKTIERLKEIYPKYSDKEVRIFAVYTMENIDSWKEYIKEQNLNWTHVSDNLNKTHFRDIYDAWANPTIYILDANKTIIAKKFDIEQLEGLLNHFMENAI